jgi:hypothetical protein
MRRLTVGGWRLAGNPLPSTPEVCTVVVSFSNRQPQPVN